MYTTAYFLEEPQGLLYLQYQEQSDVALVQTHLHLQIIQSYQYTYQES